jgi:hypothetical protein
MRLDPEQGQHQELFHAGGLQPARVFVLCRIKRGNHEAQQGAPALHRGRLRHQTVEMQGCTGNAVVHSHAHLFDAAPLEAQLDHFGIGFIEEDGPVFLL